MRTNEHQLHWMVAICLRTQTMPSMRVPPGYPRQPSNGASLVCPGSIEVGGSSVDRAERVAEAATDRENLIRVMPA